jgi:alpha-L-fucosidase
MVKPTRLLVLAAYIAPGYAAPAQDSGPANVPDGAAVPTPDQAAWQDLELGMFIHIAPQTWQDSESDDLSTPLSAINPEKLDTDQWVAVAESMGAKYIVFVAKHEGGFCWWPTATNDYSVAGTPWRAGRGDILADLSASCARRNMKLGVYLSPRDLKHGVGIGGRATDPAGQAHYERMFRAQLTELLTRYGDMTEVWFDGSLVFDVGDILRAHAPRAMIFQGPQATIRWVGNEDGIAPDPAWNAVPFPKQGLTWGDYTAADGDPAGNRWLPNECDARLRATWFWRTDNQATLKTVDMLMDMYRGSVGRGATLLLNLTPDRTGAIPTADAARAAEFGAEIRRQFAAPAAQSSGPGPQLLATLPSPLAVRNIVIMEDLATGEHIRAWSLEGLAPGGAWRPLATGESIGHKRIVYLPRPLELSEVRLTIAKAVGEARIRQLALYGEPPDPHNPK